MIQLKLGSQNFWGSRKKASMLISEIAKSIQNNDVEIDFEGVDEISVSFAHQMIYDLLQHTTSDKIKFKNADENNLQKLNKQLQILK